MTRDDDSPNSIAKRRRRERRTSGTDDRALSDLVGFVLTFSVIIASVALVSTFGLDALEDAQQNEQMRNAERAFTVLAENFNEVERGQAPRRTSEIDLNEGTLTVVEDSEFTITVVGSAPPSGSPPPTGSDWSTDIETDALQFERDEASMFYENGATFRSSGPSGGSIVEDKPELLCTENKAVLSFVSIQTDTDRALGSGTVRVTSERVSSEVLYPTSRESSGRDGTGVEVEVDSPRASGWQTYFIGDQENWEQPDESKPEFVCDDIDEIVIRETVIEVRFTR